MRAQGYVLQSSQRMIQRQWLDIENVQSGTRNLILLQDFD